MNMKLYFSTIGFIIVPDVYIRAYEANGLFQFVKKFISNILEFYGKIERIIKYSDLHISICDNKSIESQMPLCYICKLKQYLAVDPKRIQIEEMIDIATFDCIN